MKNLENGGERVDIDFYNLNYEFFNIFQKSHYKRYEFAISQLQENEVVGDMACGSGYGSVMLSRNCREVKGYDIDLETIEEIKKRYEKEKNIIFEAKNLLELNDFNIYDKIISFETIEHFSLDEISSLLVKFHKALKHKGKLIFSTPYNQEKCPSSMRYHKTFYITEDVVNKILNNLFKIDNFYYQDYDSHDLTKDNQLKHFIVCVAEKI